MRLALPPGTAALLTARRCTLRGHQGGARQSQHSNSVPKSAMRETQLIQSIAREGGFESEALHAYQGRNLRKFCAKQHAAAQMGIVAFRAARWLAMSLPSKGGPTKAPMPSGGADGEVAVAPSAES